MDLKTFGIVFVTVFLAELGDKTQLATVLFASRESTSVLLVFAGAALALVVATAIAVIFGSTLSHVIEGRYLSYIAGAGFIAVGCWTIWQA
ncbi:MAG: TMEM165/GDT1 family protein [Woeseia sp.]|nr:TMEM165/GDT1 family protein [Woeseia sp.]MBT8095946.1 TMEM165/GDT1 family protein [Woeseia sp.]NNE61091.1 TMEM165/GDT1 family protein [Woeseia sp.]NNL53772.1 TMEM165/GDT1 family protein [Woeseia sp.]